MKKIIGIFSLIVGLALPVLSHAQGFPGGAGAAANVQLNPDILDGAAVVRDWSMELSNALNVNLQEMDVVHFCYHGDLSRLQMKVRVKNVEGEFENVNQTMDEIIFVGDAGQKTITLTKREPFMLFKNTEDGIKFYNTKALLNPLGSKRTLLKIFAPEGEKAPYVDYVPAGSATSPCTPGNTRYSRFETARGSAVEAQLTPVVEEVTQEPPASPPATPPEEALPPPPADAPAASGGCSFTGQGLPNSSFIWMASWGIVLTLGLRRRRA